MYFMEYTYQSSFSKLFLTVLLMQAVLSLPINDDENEDLVIDISCRGNRIFQKPSLDTGKLVKNWNENSEVNPEELGEYAEGDIIIGQSRNGLIEKTYRWAEGEIPYSIDGNFDEDSLDAIEKAINQFHTHTCLRFRNRTEADTDYISILNSDTGCWSSIGRIGGKQELNLQSPSCTTRVGTPIHELMHAVGFLHEQNRADRDDYVTIEWENIKKDHEHNFKKDCDGKTTDFGVSYDFGSVMHYRAKAFSANGLPTIIPKEEYKDLSVNMGQRNGFSKSDLTKINRMYKCSKQSPTSLPNETSTETFNPLANIFQSVLGIITRPRN